MTVVCQSCGSTHSDAYARVFGDSHDRLHGCPDCQTRSLRSRGATAGVEVDYPDRSDYYNGGGA